MGLVTGLHAYIPGNHSQWLAGPGHTPQGRAVGRGRAPNSGRPTASQEALPPWGAPVPPPKRAEPARKSTGSGLGDKTPRPQPPHQQPVGSGPLAARPKDGRSGLGERPTPDAPHRGKRPPPPRVPSFRPHSAQNQLARAGAVGLVTGHHTHTPRTHSQWVAGPGRTAKGRAVERGKAPSPGRPTPRQKAPQPGTLVPPRQHAKPACKSARCAVGEGSPRRYCPHPRPAGSGPRPNAPRGGSRAWESAQPREPRAQASTPPPGRACATRKARKASLQERAQWVR